MARETQHIIAVSVGNSRTAIGAFTESTLDSVQRIDNADGAPAIVSQITALSADHAGSSAVVVAGVNEPVERAILQLLRSADDLDVYRIGPEIAPAIGLRVDPDAKTGQDRLLCAAAAYERFGQACVVIDAGTAVTVDFVDGEGTFHGGGIAPGAAMQLAALHEHTAALPSMKFAAPTDEPFGANTQQAMLQGVFYGIRGLVRLLSERYAEEYRAYPKIVATGGDAVVLFTNDDFVEHIVDDLVLHGIHVSFRAAHGSHRALEAE